MDSAKHIALLPGDGIGPEVMAEAVKVLQAVTNRFGRRFEFVTAPVGAAAIALCGNPYPEETHSICMAADAVLFGAVGDPAFDRNPSVKIRPEQGLLAIRQQLGLYANIRPTICYDALKQASPLRPERISGTDYVVFRELTGGLYFGARGRNKQGDKAFDTCEYSREEIRRIARMAFEKALLRKRHLTLVDKSNILETSRLWREEVLFLHRNYPQVALDCLYVDNAAMLLVTQPAQFDVILTENMFGDILTDLSAAIAGSMGILPSASLGSHCLFEPVHGSYPQARGMRTANPVAMILSAAMMMEYAFGWEEEARRVEQVCLDSFRAGAVTCDLAEPGQQALHTDEVGDWIASRI